MTPYIIAGIFVVALYGVIALRNLVKKIVALSFANSAIIMFFVHFGSLSGTRPPMVDGSPGAVVDPVPQALMLTAIVVGVCVTSVALVLVYRIYRRHGTLDARELERQVWSEGDGE